MSALPIARLSVDEYLALDRAAEVPSEYHDGEMLPVASVSVEHADIGANLAVWAKKALRSSPCRMTGPSVRVRVKLTKFVIPDLMIYCGKPLVIDEFRDTVTNPKVIIEILSPSTADYDYGTKFILYRGLPSFEEYVLVSQNEARVEVYRKTQDGFWVLRTCSGLDAVVPIESIGAMLPLTDVYDGIEFRQRPED